MVIVIVGFGVVLKIIVNISLVIVDNKFRLVVIKIICFICWESNRVVVVGVMSIVIIKIIFIVWSEVIIVNDSSSMRK